MPLTFTDDKWDIRQFLHKIETIEGEDAVPTPAADAHVLHDGSIEISEQEVILNRDSPDSGARRRGFIQRHGIMTGGVELAGAGTPGVAAPIGRLMQTSGHAQSLVSEAGPPQILAADYTPVLRGFPSGSSYFYHDGERFVLTGGRGAIESFKFSIHEFNLAQYRGIGQVFAISEDDVPADPDLSAWREPLVGVQANMRITLDGQPLDAISLEINTGVTLGMKYSTEASRARHTVREVTGTLTIFRPLIADSDIRMIHRTRTLVPLEVDYQDDDPANQLNWLGPNVQLGEPRLTNVEGDKAWVIPVWFVRADVPDYRLRFGGEAP